MSKAFIFDLNGTIINDMEYHEHAWYSILNNDYHAGLSHEEVAKQMYGKNEEVLTRVFGPGKFTREEMHKISIEKEKRYQSEYRNHLKLLDGLESFLQKAKKEMILIALGTAAIPFNVDFVLDNCRIRKYFDAIVSADDVTTSKPDPETFIKAAEKLNVPFDECIVFEDSPKGVEAAQNAGMKAIVIKTMHEENAFEKYDNVLMFISDYMDEKLLHYLKIIE
ncbi:MAG: HAD family hydrolase [Ilyomonas sp.]